MNFKDEAIKAMYDALKDFINCKGAGCKCAPNDLDFENGEFAIKKAEQEMSWLKFK